ncbi:MAG: hypothetical protein AAF662_08360 [Pseudomonadota bacterium]
MCIQAKARAGVWGALALSAFSAQGGIIDFETTAAGVTPIDNQVVGFADKFRADGVSVRFGFDSNGDGNWDTKAVFEEVGNRDRNKDTGFWGIGGAKDIAAPGYEDQLGKYFLRQREPYKPFGTFTILYDADNPVTAASGEIWDIDGTGHRTRKTEQFLVQAFNGNALLDEIYSPLGTDLELDGKPWLFGFDGLSDIERIEISFTGSKTSGIGLAFNNFSPIQNVENAAVPIPATAALLTLGLVGVTRRQTKIKHINSEI